MNKMELVENGLREWAEQVERRRKEVVENPDLTDQEMVICLDVGELSKAELLDVEIFLDLLDDENNDLIVEEHYGDYTDQSGTVYRLRLLKEIVRDNLVDEYEYKNGILRIAVSYCFRYHRFDGGFDYCDITKEAYEEIVENLTEVPEDEYIGYGDEPDDPDDEWDDFGDKLDSPNDGQGSDEDFWDEYVSYWDEDDWDDADLNEGWRKCGQ